MLNFRKKITTQNAFGPGLSEKEKADKVASQAKRLAELQDLARKVAESDQFKEFKKTYIAEKEVLIETLESIDPSDIGAIARIQERLRLYRQIFQIEKQAD